MKSKEDFAGGCATILKGLRESSCLTQQQIADAVYVDVKTWKRYEAGTSVPTVPQFLSIFQELRQDALQPVLKFLYPEVYDNLDASSSNDELRNATVHYFSTIASDHEIRAINYLIFGGHGSNWLPQLEEFLMVDHLPMKSRVVLGAMIAELYELSNKNENLVGTDHVMPDLRVFSAGLEQGRKAAYENRESYTTI